MRSHKIKTVLVPLGLALLLMAAVSAYITIGGTFINCSSLPDGRCTGERAHDGQSSTDPDFINGSNLDDLIFGEGGNDMLLGNGADDCLYGDWEFFNDDAEWGWRGVCPLWEEGVFDPPEVPAGVVEEDAAGSDQLLGGDGDDHLCGNYGNDVLWGGRGTDTYCEALVKRDLSEDPNADDIYVFQAGDVPSGVQAAFEPPGADEVVPGGHRDGLGMAICIFIGYAGTEMSQDGVCTAPLVTDPWTGGQIDVFNCDQIIGVIPCAVPN